MKNFLRINTLKNAFLFCSMVLLLLSCGGGATHHLASGTFSKNETYNINSYYGCCGCEAKYFLINSGKRKTEQVIYSYNCSGTSIPTKFIFNYNKQGEIISCDKYIATTANDYTIKLTDGEKFLLTAIESSTILAGKYTVIKLSLVTGFKKTPDQSIGHSFPLIKKGYKLPVH
jgi:hypothetical protein